MDAVFNCIKALVPHEAKLELYQVHAVTEGTDAQAEVSVRLEEDGRAVTGRGGGLRLRRALRARAQRRPRADHDLDHDNADR